MHRVARACLAVALIVWSIGVASSEPRAQVGEPAASAADFGELFDIGGGRRLYLECHGNGGPTVILESGYRNDGRVWAGPVARGVPVAAQVAKFTRVCTYDRPGTYFDQQQLGRSDPVPMPRTADDIVADLDALLRVAEVPGPYVLAGHQLGGLFARLFTSAHPGEVAGLVLVDAWPERLESFLGPTNWSIYQQVVQSTAGLEGVPDLETIDLEAAAASMLAAAAGSPLRRVPYAVLSRGLPEELPAGVPPDFSPALEDAWATGQAELATLAAGGRHVIARRSSDYLQLDQPALVVRNIRRVVESVRSGVLVDCTGGRVFCRASVGMAGGAAQRKVTIRLRWDDLKLVSVRPNRSALFGTYDLAPGRRRTERNEYVTSLSAVQGIPRRSRLIFTFRAPNPN